MKNNLNAWNFGATWRYYLAHPWKWIREIGWNIHNSYDRLTKGYCCTDWMNFDMWFKEVASAMFRDWAMHGHGYHFDTPEQWNSWLHKMADQITKCQDEDYGNEYYQPFIDQLMKNPQTILTEEETEEEKELRKKYYERSREVYEEQKKLFKDTMEEMLEHWDCLWD